MSLDIPLVCICVVLVVIIFVHRYGSLEKIASIMGIYIAPPRETPDTAEEYDSDEDDFGVDDDEAPSPLPPAATQPTQRRFFTTGKRTKPQPNEDDPEFMEHVKSRMPHRR